MTIRTIRRTSAFRRPFYLKGVDRLLPPADYRVVTDEELIDGLSFSAYRRVSTAIFVPAESGCAVEMVIIDPLDLQAAQEHDLAIHYPLTTRCESSQREQGRSSFVIHQGITLEPDGPGSYKFKFATGRGEISERVRVGQEGPPDNRSEADQQQAALNQILALSREFAQACGD